MYEILSYFCCWLRYQQLAHMTIISSFWFLIYERFISVEKTIWLNAKYKFFWIFNFGCGIPLSMCRYVVEKDTKNNVVFVSRNYYSIDKRRRIFRVGSLRWNSGKPSGKVRDLRCKVNNMITFYT